MQRSVRSAAFIRASERPLDPGRQFFIGRRFVVSRTNRQMAAGPRRQLSRWAGWRRSVSLHAQHEYLALPLQDLSNNLHRMPRWFGLLSASVLMAVVLSFAACKEDSEAVSTDVCASGRRWI